MLRIPSLTVPEKEPDRGAAETNVFLMISRCSACSARVQREGNWQKSIIGRGEVAPEFT